MDRRCGQRCSRKGPRKSRHQRRLQLGARCPSVAAGPHSRQSCPGPPTVSDGLAQPWGQARGRQESLRTALGGIISGANLGFLLERCSTGAGHSLAVKRIGWIRQIWVQCSLQSRLLHFSPSRLASHRQTPKPATVHVARPESPWLGPCLTDTFESSRVEPRPSACPHQPASTCPAPADAYFAYLTNGRSP
jgi:hypothetical protein